MKKVYALMSLMMVGLLSMAQTTNAGKTDPGC